jgi:hypothetical protein
VSTTGAYWNGDFAEGIEPDGGVRIKLLQIPLAGGSPLVLAEESGISHIAVSSNAVYWTVEPLGGLPGTIRRVPLKGGAVSSVASDQLGLSDLTADDTHVCWLNFANGPQSFRPVSPSARLLSTSALEPGERARRIFRVTERRARIAEQVREAHEQVVVRRVRKPEPAPSA